MFALFIPLGIIVAASLVVLSALSLHLVLMQLVWVTLGVALIVVFIFFDARAIFNSRAVVWGFYGLSLLLMLAALVASPLIRNTHSWLVLGPFTLQPVELMKVALILLYANFFSRRHIAIARWKNILTSFVFFVIPAAIAMKLPDFGSTMIFFAIWFGFLLLLGLPLRRTVVAFLVLGLVGGAVWGYVFKPYQRARIVGFLDPNANALGINYSVTQAKIAIGSAGFFGKGYAQGSQTELGFLSEPTEDFIFAALIEEWGILGALVVVGAFLFLEFQILRIGALADENFEKFICLGTAMMFGVQFLLNAGSATGLTPVVGVTFPFLSYGGSSMLADFFMVAMVNSIRRKS